MPRHRSRLASGREFLGNGNFAFAISDGGPVNDVMTAIDDFIAERAADGRNLAFVPAVFGPGVLFDAQSIDDFLPPA